jgi:hypothetical protein
VPPAPREQVWDLGGQDRLRKSWGTYYINTNAVILVVDSTDREHMPTVKAELAAITAHEDLSNAVLLILANKQDAEGAMTAAEVSTALSLHANKQHDWQIQVRARALKRSAARARRARLAGVGDHAGGQEERSRPVNPARASCACPPRLHTCPLIPSMLPQHTRRSRELLG